MIVFTAIEELRDPLEILLFYKQYKEYLEGDIKKDKEDRFSDKTADEICVSNIGYVLGYYDKKYTDLWKKTLPFITHPIFGDLKENPVSGEGFNIIYNNQGEIGEKTLDMIIGFLDNLDNSKKKVHVKALEKSLLSSGLWSAASVKYDFDMPLTKKNSKYSSVYIKPLEDSDIDYNGSYFHLLGMLAAIRKTIKKEYGEEADIFIEKD